MEIAAGILGDALDGTPPRSRATAGIDVPSCRSPARADHMMRTACRNRHRRPRVGRHPRSRGSRWLPAHSICRSKVRAPRCDRAHRGTPAKRRWCCRARRGRWRGSPPHALADQPRTLEQRGIRSGFHLDVAVVEGELLAAREIRGRESEFTRARDFEARIGRSGNDRVDPVGKHCARTRNNGTEIGLLIGRRPGSRGEGESTVVRCAVLLNEVQTLDADHARAGRRGLDAPFPVRGVAAGNSVADYDARCRRVPGGGEEVAQQRSWEAEQVEGRPT